MRALAISTAMCILTLGGLECVCRTCTRINFLDNSKNLFVDHRFGDSRGNLVSGEAMAFGQTIDTDENGFRIDPAFKDPVAERAILFLGDSVGFGCGVEESQTAIGRLRRALPDRRLYNASTVGYCLMDYRNVADAFTPKHPEVKDVYVLMCLNDIYDGSAIEIKKHLGRAPDDTAKDAASSAKKITFLQDANDWLRSRSKLYLFAKNAANDASLRIFRYDLEMYRDSDAYFEKNMAVLTDLNDRFRAGGVGFKVVVMPYEVQLRSQNEDFLLPQHMITAYLKKHGIAYIDATDRFRAAAGNASRKLYLYGDAMHFSAAGHEILYEILEGDIKASAPAQQGKP